MLAGTEILFLVTDIARHWTYYLNVLGCVVTYVQALNLLYFLTFLLKDQIIFMNYISSWFSFCFYIFPELFFFFFIIICWYRLIIVCVAIVKFKIEPGCLYNLLPLDFLQGKRFSSFAYSACNFSHVMAQVM